MNFKNVLLSSYRTGKKFEVLDHCEIPPIRTEFIEELGEGGFGKVHKAKLKDGLEFFETEQDRAFNTKKKEKIVAVKELHGVLTQLMNSIFLKLFLR